MTDRPQKITFGEMREMGVRGVSLRRMSLDILDCPRGLRRLQRGPSRVGSVGVIATAWQVEADASQANAGGPKGGSGRPDLSGSLEGHSNSLASFSM